MLKSDT